MDSAPPNPPLGKAEAHGPPSPLPSLFPLQESATILLPLSSLAGITRPLPLLLEPSQPQSVNIY